MKSNNRNPFNMWRSEIEAYCQENQLNFEKLEQQVRSWGQNDLVFLHYEEGTGRLGLLDETPMPVVLMVRKENEKLIFEQTENTAKYLGVEHNENE